MEEYEYIGFLFTKIEQNSHLIYNPISLVKCNKFDDYMYDVENIGPLCTIYESNYGGESLAVGFIHSYEELKEDYDSIEEGIESIRYEVEPYIIIQKYDEDNDITSTYKVNLYGESMIKIADFDEDKDELLLLDKQIEVSTNIDVNEIIKSNNKQKNKYEYIKDINMKELYYKIKESIIGQDETIQQVVSTIDRNYNIDNYRQKTNILLIGPSGSGKTEMFKTIAETINVPIIIEDSEKYSAVGYYGDSVEDMLVNLYHKADGNLDAAQRGIIVVDEIDKKITNHKGDVSGDRVLNALLTMMEGTICRINITGDQSFPTYVMFDTSKVTFVLSGAFSEMTLKEKGIGLNNDLVKQKKYKDISIEDLNKFGIPMETLRRVSIYRLNELSIDDLVNIMINSKNSALKEYKKYAKKKQVNLLINDKAIRKIAEIAHKKEIGASGIKDTLNDILTPAFFEIGMNEGKYSSIKITEQSLDSKPPYILNEKRNKVKKNIKKKS